MNMQKQFNEIEDDFIMTLDNGIYGCPPQAFFPDETNEDTIIRAIAANCFYDVKQLKQARFGEGLWHIGEKAFYNSGIQNVWLPDSTLTIGSWAFIYCESLKEIKIPPLVNHLLSNCFYDCRNMKIVEFAGSIKYIDSKVFAHCKSLEILKFNDGLLSIGSSAMAYCDNLRSVYLPEGTMRLGDQVFREDRNLKGVYLPKTIGKIGEDIFKNCPQVTALIHKNSYAEKYCKENKIPIKIIEGD